MKGKDKRIYYVIEYYTVIIKEMLLPITRFVSFRCAISHVRCARHVTCETGRFARFEASSSLAGTMQRIDGTGMFQSLLRFRDHSVIRDISHNILTHSIHHTLLSFSTNFRSSRFLHCVFMNMK